VQSPSIANTSAVPLAFDAEQGLTLKLYERGCALLEQCMTFDETKYWDSFADAAIAWGKIHKSDRVEQLARALKLRAFRRLGELAAMERPPTPPRPRNGEKTGGPTGRPGGPLLWLEKRGLDRNAAQSARMLSQMPAKKFEELTQRPRPPLPSSCRKGEYSPWQKFYMLSSMAQVAANTSRVTPAAAAKLNGIEKRDRGKLKRTARQLAQWFHKFAEALEEAI
jgi:hypothetical protein